MLDHLFGSRTRVKLLLLFFHHPEGRFFVRELTRRIDTQINAVRRELGNLVTIGLIVEGTPPEDEIGEKRPGLRRKYYTVNKTCPLFQEVHALLMKARIFLEQKVDTRIARMGDVSYLAFLGVFLGVPGQPVDLFLVGTVNARELKKIVDELEEEIGGEINYTCMTPQEFAYRKEIADRFLHGILQAPKHIVINRLSASQGNA